MNNRSLLFLIEKRVRYCVLPLLLCICAMVFLCFGVTIHQSLKEEKDKPYELSGTLTNQTLSDDLMEQIRKTKNVVSVSVMKTTSGLIQFDTYKKNITITSVDASYINISLEKGVSFDDKSDALKLVVNHAFLKQLMDGEKEETKTSTSSDKEEKKINDIETVSWLDTPCTIQFPGSNTRVTAEICGILEEESDAPLAYVSNHVMERLEKYLGTSVQGAVAPQSSSETGESAEGETPSNTESSQQATVKTENNNLNETQSMRILVRITNSGMAESVSNELTTIGLQFSNLNVSLQNEWKLMDRDGTYFFCIGIVLLISYMIFFTRTRRLYDEKNQNTLMTLKSIGFGKRDILRMKHMEILLVTGVGCLLGFIVCRLCPVFVVTDNIRLCPIAYTVPALYGIMVGLVMLVVMNLYTE